LGADFAPKKQPGIHAETQDAELARRPQNAVTAILALNGFIPRPDPAWLVILA
jgi:hypothetical protein